MPFTAEPPDTQTSFEQSILNAGQTLAEFGIFGLIWLDRDLIVTKLFGKLAEKTVTIGTPVTDNIYAFVGLEEEIRSLERAPDRMLELPGIGVVQDDKPPQRLNFTICWDRLASSSLLVVYRSNAMTEMEMELSRQTRARLIAEAEVRQTSRELARANADLEAFAAVVSHDLKSPLRHTRHLVDAAEQDAQSGNHSALSGKLDEIRRYSDRMSKMLTVLFDYSSLGRKDEANEEVDTGQLVRAICASLPLADFEIAIEGQWPVLMTPRAPLDLVLRNLIANAAAHHDKDRGTIVVAADSSGDALKIEVADDGPGIPDAAQAVIFLPFRTLAQSASEGSTGMGLAMVKRTLDTIGGTIMLESKPQPQRGAKFTVMWPKRIDA